MVSGAYNFAKQYTSARIIGYTDKFPKIDKQFYELQHKDIRGEDFDFSKLKEKKAILVFNSAM